MTRHKVNITSVFKKSQAQEDLTSALRKEACSLEINFQECDMQEK